MEEVFGIGGGAAGGYRGCGGGDVKKVVIILLGEVQVVIVGVVEEVDKGVDVLETRLRWWYRC